jgi:hypothetical protein
VGGRERAVTLHSTKTPRDFAAVPHRRRTVLHVP